MFLKIIERLMYSRLLSYVNKHSLLYKYQTGFRYKCYPTNFAMLTLIDNISLTNVIMY